jgi:5-formyltetrahydrofolate cyclo-ligase
MNSNSESRQALRKTIRQKRRSLTAAERETAKQQVCQTILNSELWQTSQHIALFLAADGEIDLAEIFTQAQKEGKTSYLPVCLHDSCTLEFYPWTPGDELSTTPLGVLEPARRDQKIEPDALDLVLTPLVAFDENCQRMGMGKGFYDRTFTFKSPKIHESDTKMAAKSPILLGIAHECQRVESLETAWWDVPLDAVLTPEKCYGRKEIL